MNSQREPFMAAAAASIAALYPDRVVKRGLQDPAQLGDAVLRQGVYALLAEGTAEWATHRGREGQDGTLDFVIVGYGRVDDDASTLDVEQAEATMENELLAWCQASKPEPLDAVYPRAITYSRGFDTPYTWVVLSAQALYI